MPFCAFVLIDQDDFTAYFPFDYRIDYQSTFFRPD